MSSAVNRVLPATETGGEEETPKTRPNPVVLEALVNVTGARPSSGSGSRDLFSEDTATELVFKDGAVIRLSAAVSVGQLLFLTNKKSKEEVVCQVLRKRSFKPTTCYVELQFTEEKLDFWGVAFPEGNTDSSKPKAAELVEAEETTEDDPRTPVTARSAEDVHRLVKEVGEMREQLQTLEKKDAGEAVESPKLKVETEEKHLSAEGAEEARSGRGNKKPKIHAESAVAQPAEAKAAEEATAPLMPAAADKEEAARPMVGMTLPNRENESKEVVEERRHPVEDTLPQPGLDFSKEPQSAVHVDDRDPRPIHKAKRADTGNLRVIGLSVLLVLAVAGGAWHGKWWKYLPLGKKTAVTAPRKAVKTSPRNAPTAGGNAARRTVGEAGNVGVTAKGAPGANAPGAAAGDAGIGDSKSAEENRNGEVVAETAQEKKSAVKERVAEKAASKKKGAASPATETSAAEPVAKDAPVIAARLLKAATPVYPPDAMRNYITGDVKAEVVVEATGRVGEVKVISGPQALRAAAVEALKQYEYAPGTQGGEAVASKVVVTVKFWFNP